MLSDEVIEKVTERLVERIESLNLYILKKIARSIKKIGMMTPSEAQQLIRILEFGGDYDKITNKIAEITELNVKDIRKIFRDVAKENYAFAEQFYKYRNKKFIPFEENELLQRQIETISNQMVNNYIANTKVIGYSITDDKGNFLFQEVTNAYKETVDEAILSVSQGKTTFQEEMARAMQKLGSSGLKYVDYSTGWTRRLDSALAMNIRDGVRQLHNENERLFGEEFGANGVEITVHSNPAPDHAEVQGRIFRNEEFDKFQNDIDCVDVNGKEFPAEFEGHDRRSISQYNCYHYVFPVIVELKKPRFTDEQLQEIIDKSKEEIEFENKKYSRYEAGQLQRKMERTIRKYKDLQIMGKESGNDKLLNRSQKKIDQLTSKYYELSKVSGLPTKLERLQVQGYKPVKLS